MAPSRIAPAAALALAALLLPACGETERPPPRTPFGATPPTGPEAVREREAEQALRELDEAIAASAKLEPPAAFARQKTFGPRIDDAVERASGTRFENKAVFLQAQWRFQFIDDGRGVDESLTRLDGLPQTTLKLYGRALRVQHLLRQQRLVSARDLAEQVVAGEPGLGYLLDLVRWHERVGGVVEATAGSALDGQPLDPLASPERFLLYLHVKQWAAQEAFIVARYLNAIGNGDCRLVVVVRDGSPARVAEDLARIPNSAKCTALVCRTQAEVRALLTAWTPPLEPWTVLLDGKRRIAKVELRPGDLVDALK